MQGVQEDARQGSHVEASKRWSGEVTRDPERIPFICQMLQDLWSFHPEWTFEQLMVQVSWTHGGLMYPAQDVDERMEESLLRWLEMEYYEGVERE